MKTLIAYEFKKLLSRKALWVTLALVLAMMAVGSRYPLQARLGGSVQGMRDAFAPFEGRVLTDALATEARALLLQYAATHPDEMLWPEPPPDDEEFIDPNPLPMPVNYRGDDYAYGLWAGYDQLIHGRTAEYLRESGQRMQAVLDDGRDPRFKDGRLLTPAQRQDYERSIEDCRHPAVVRYAAGWEKLLEELGYSTQTSLYVFALLIMGLTALFSGEHTAGMDKVLLCTSARRRAVLAKLAVSAIYSLTVYALIFGLTFASVAVGWGLDGGQQPVRNLCKYVSSYLPFSAEASGTLSVSALYLWALAMAALAAVVCSLLVAVVASVFRHPLAALGTAAAVLMAQFLPAMAEGTLQPVLLGRQNETARLIFDVFLPRDLQTYEYWYIALPAFQLGVPGNILDFAGDGWMLAALAAAPLVLGSLSLWLVPRLYLKPRKH